MRRVLLIPALAALSAGLSPGAARAQFNVLADTREVREDWLLVVAQGDPASNGPQVMTYMSAVNDSSDVYAWFLINARDAPNPYTPGGLMVQVWDYSDKLVTSSTSTTDTAELSNTNEKVLWTQRLYFNANKGQMTYEVLNGWSTTWGTFGSSAGLAAITYKTSVSATQSFSKYDPNVSVKNSRVGWMPANVSSLTLLAVRQYDAKGTLIKTDLLNLPVNLTPQ